MRGFLFRLVLPCLVVCQAAGQTPERAAMKVIRPEAIRARMRYLADDLLEGRGTGTKGYDLAARYVAAQFEQLGLEPAGQDSTYYQPVPLRRLEPAAEQSAVALVRDGREDRLMISRDVTFYGNALYPDANFRARAVFAGFGVSAPELGYDDYAGVNVRGKIVVTLYGAPPRFPSAERAHFSGITKTKEAARRGALAIVVLWVGDVQERFAFSRLVDYLKSPGTGGWTPRGNRTTRSGKFRPTLCSHRTAPASSSQALPRGSMPSGPMARPTSRRASLCRARFRFTP